ncbi:MAG: HPF/RaiA family ribosome-associated protein [Deltaproteobacteria bacterium]|nr:HPF/RaiA family ribosome-associated protein [Deltaproteobacteria bacterium]
MQLQVSAKGVGLTVATRSYVERRIRFALGRFLERVERVHVRLSDVNGPRGGVDKRCLIRTRLLGFPTVVVEQTDATLRAAIDRSAGRVGRTVARRLDRALMSMRDRTVGEPRRKDP